MNGGIDAWNGLVSKAQVEQGIYLIEGDETPEEVISLAYGLEEGAYRFYRDLAERATDGENKDLFETLSQAEIQHKENLWEKYRTLIGSSDTQETFASGIVAETMEGGKTADQVLALYPDWIHHPREALELAMSLETDALDLYLRMAQKSKDEDVTATFYDLADEEKTHLRRLGELIRTKASRG